METKDLLNGRTGVGAGIGALVGFMLGGPLGAGIGAVVGGSLAHAAPKHQKGVLTPKRKLAYESAMTSMKDPADLVELAKSFDQVELRHHATMLRKRAALRALPPEAKEARRVAFREGMASDDPDGIEAIAEACRDSGALDAAAALSGHANAVRAARLAGANTRPLDERAVGEFADKLSKAVMHFGPESEQAQSAARNFVEARGEPATEENVAEAIQIAMEEVSEGGRGAAGAQTPADDAQQTAPGAMPAPAAEPAADGSDADDPDEDVAVAPATSQTAGPSPGAQGALVDQANVNAEVVG